MAALATMMVGCGAATTPAAGAPPASTPAAVAPAVAPKWTELGGSLGPLAGHEAAGVVVGNGSVVALLGAQVWRYESGSWGLMPALPRPASNLNPTEVAVAGSQLWVGAYGFAEYDPATGTWAASDPVAAFPIVGNRAANAAGVVVALPAGTGSPWEWTGHAWAQMSGLASALSGGFTYAAAVASDGTVWVGTSSGVWAGSAGSAWGPVGGASNPLASHRITRIAAASGQIAAYGPGVGVVEYASGSWQTLGREPAGVARAPANSLAGLLGGSSDPLAWSPSGSLAVGTRNGVIWTYVNGSWTSVAHLGASIESLACAPNGTLVASTAAGVYADGRV